MDSDVTFFFLFELRKVCALVAMCVDIFIIADPVYIDRAHNIVSIMFVVNIVI